MPDSHLVASPERIAATQSHSSWSLQIGGLRLGGSRTREMRGTLSPNPSAISRRAGPFAAGMVTGVGAVAIALVGANAAPRPVEAVRYMVSVPVPAAPARHLVREHARLHVGRASSRMPALAPMASGEHFDGADEPYVARAMATGAFQEWDDAAGQHRFLTAGPARAVGGRFCRNVALLVRLAEGGSHVRSAERCTTGPVSDQAPQEADAAPAD